MMVSVLITSYNHASTLRRAIDSVLMQTGVVIQVVVIDDGSTDGSVEILREYYDKGLISVLHNGEHYGMMVSYREGFKRCSGEYVAICDCDDFWLEKFKLQRQVEYMDANPDSGLCLTKVMTCDEHGNYLSGMRLPGEVTFDKLLRGNACVHAQSYLIRKSELDKIDFQQFIDRGFLVWDYPLVLALSRSCRFHTMDFYSAVFVRSVESTTQTRSRLCRLRYVMGNYRIRWWYIGRYGCKVSTVCYLVYRLLRDIYAIIFKRWYK